MNHDYNYFQIVIMNSTIITDSYPNQLSFFIMEFSSITTYHPCNSV